MNVTSEMLEKIRGIREYNKVYLNENPIVRVGGAPLLMHEIALAGLMAQLNMVFIGRSGPGKSQLIADIKNGIFNGDAVHMRGSTDLNVRKIYCSIDLKLYEKGMIDEAVKPRKSARRLLHIMEEFNRCPPVVANEWLAIGDGVLDVDGRQIQLGDGYRVAIGAANVGNGEFSGTFQTDNALKERLVLALDFDGSHRPREIDYFDIFENSSSPRVVQTEKADNSSLIVELSQETEKLAQSVAYFVRMMQVYLATGLDEVEIARKTCSKEEMPNLGSVVERDKSASKDILNYVTPPSVRSAKVFGLLVPSLAAVALSKDARADGIAYDACFGALELILPFSDSIPKKVIANNNGSRRLAAKEVVELIRKDMPASELFEEGLQKASDGKLKADDTMQFERPRVRCFSRFLHQLNERAQMQKAVR